MTLNKIWIGTLVLGSFGVWVPDAAALESECVSKLGSCSIGNVPDDSLSCECTDGSGGGGSGGNEWAGLDQAQLDQACEETIADFCGPFIPPDGIECDSNLGYCVVDNEPDSFSCECEGGAAGGGGGGNEWDGLDDDALLDVCFEQLDSFCGGPTPPDWLCENELGGCDISFEDGEGSITCGCQDGGGVFPADPDWAGLSEEDLIAVCFEQIPEFCGVIPSDTDSTTTDSMTTDSTTTDSTTTDSTTDETTDATVTDPTAGDDSSGSDSGTVTDPADPADPTDPTDPDPTVTDSASASASNTDGDESSSGGGAGASNDGAGCSCDAGGSPAGSAWGLALLGLVGWRCGRRRAHLRG